MEVNRREIFRYLGYGRTEPDERIRTLAESCLEELEQELSLIHILSIPYSKSTFVLDGQSSEWEVLQTSIGQGGTQITPMHSLMITSAIANGGVLMKPCLIDHIVSADGENGKKFMPELYGSLMTAQEAGALSAMMERVVTDGTASALQTDAYRAAGKTGSAE